MSLTFYPSASRSSSAHDVDDRGRGAETRELRCRTPSDCRLCLLEQVQVRSLSFAPGYAARADIATYRHYLATTGIIPFGVGGWFHSARSTAHIIGQTVSTVRSAYALKDVFEALAAAEKSGLSDEKKKELEDKAAQMVRSGLLLYTAPFADARCSLRVFTLSSRCVCAPLCLLLTVD